MHEFGSKAIVGVVDTIQCPQWSGDVDCAGAIIIVTGGSFAPTFVPGLTAKLEKA